MIKEVLFELLISNISVGNVPEVTSLVIEHNDIAKQFTGSELQSISTAFKASLLAYSDMYNFFVKTNLYKNGTGTSAFINELPFAQQVENYVERSFTSYVASTPSGIVGYPDCIDKNMLTGGLQGWELKNYSGRQYLPETKFDVRYDIITKRENFEYYRLQHPSCRIRSYEDFKLHDPFRYTLINSRYQVVIPRMREFNQVHNIKFGRFKL